MKAVETSMLEEIVDQIPETIELIYVDRRDELPAEIYREALQQGVSGREYLEDRCDEIWSWDYMMDGARDVVLEAATAAGHNLLSPLVSIEPEDWCALEELVIERNTSLGWNALCDIARNDEVVLGVNLSDDLFDYTLDHELAVQAAGAFGLHCEDEFPKWLQKVFANGDGHPSILIGIDGDDLFGLIRDIYVKAGDDQGSNLAIKLKSFDAGLLNSLYGSGWFEPVPEGIEVTIPYKDFLRNVWVDNEPGRGGTWRSIVGHPSNYRGSIDVMEV